MPPGVHTIKPAHFHQKHQGVGIISFASPHKSIKTRGMRWNLENDYEFGMYNYQSSSNEIIEEEIEITTDEPCILSLQYQKFFKLDPDLMV